MHHAGSKDKIVISQTINWIKLVVVGCNFCPFAAKALAKKDIRYAVFSDDIQRAGETLQEEFVFLNENKNTETSFIIFPDSLQTFPSYLNMLHRMESLLMKKNYEGIYQLASFHPLYCFAGAAENDAANYTNRSPYPMMQILREESITKALEGFSSPENIPGNNILFARKKGLEHMQQLLAASMQ